MNTKFSTIKKICKTALLFACIFYVLNYFYKNWNSLSVTFSISFSQIIALIALSMIYWVIYTYRFGVILEKSSGQNIIFPQLFKILVIGRFLGLIIPQLGNIYRGIQLKKNHNITYTNYIGSFTSFLWMDTSINFVIVIFVIILLEPSLKIANFDALKIVLCILLAVIAFPVILNIILPKIPFKNKRLSWIQSKLSEVFSTTINNIKSPTYLIKLTISGILIFLETIIAYHIIFCAFDVKISLAGLSLFYCLLKISVFINLTPGNLGVQEIAFAFLAQQLGIGKTEGLLVAMVARTLSTVIIIFLGTVYGGIDILAHKKSYLNEKDKTF